MKYFHLSSLIIFSLYLTSCSNENSKSKTDRTTVSSRIDSSFVNDSSIIPVDSISSIVNDIVVIEEEIPQKQLKSGDYAIAKGILKSIRGSEYGPTWIDIDVNGTHMTFEDCTGTDGFQGVKESMIGQELVIRYLYLEFLNEADIQVNDTSVRSGWDGGAIDNITAKIHKIEGIISWTTQEYGVSGDISPSKYGVIKADGTKVDITGTVYEELFKDLNGKQATVYYYVGSKMDAVTITTPIEKSSEQTELDFIREKFSEITKNMESGTYTTTAFDVEYGGEFVQFKRSKDGDILRFLSISYCSDHRCDKTSYFFWDDKLIFEFEENSHWVGNTDIVYEKRNYYYDLEHIKSIERELSGSGGYDKVKKQLANKAQNTLTPGQPFDMDEIRIYFNLTEELAKKDTYIFFPDNN